MPMEAADAVTISNLITFISGNQWAEVKRRALLLVAEKHAV